MKRIRLSLCAVLSFFLSSSESNAVEWVPFNGEVPENVARITTDPVGPPICTSSSPRMTRVGWLNEKGVCLTAGIGSKSQKSSNNIRLLVVDSPADEILEWVPYEGDIPEDAVYNETDGKPVCRAPSSGWKVPFRVGWLLNKKGYCKTVGKGARSRNQKNNISILVATKMLHSAEHEISLEDAVNNYGGLCGNNGYKLPGHGPICEEAAPIVRSEDANNVLDYAVNNYGDFCANNGYKLPGHGPICEEAAPIVKSGDGR